MTLIGFVLRDLLRNPRRSLASLVGVVIGVGLFAAVLFYIDGAGASMTKRAVAPLTLDMQRVLTAPIGGGVRLQRSVTDPSLAAGATTTVDLTVSNAGLASAHEVVVRDGPPPALIYVSGSTTLDGAPVPDLGGDPLSQGSAGIGLNIGVIAPGASRHLTYRLRAATDATATSTVDASVSTREAQTPVRANAPTPTTLLALARTAGLVSGIAAADPLVSVDLPPGALSGTGTKVPGAVRLFSFDGNYPTHYPSVRILSGSATTDGVMVSAETAQALRVHLGDPVSIALPAPAKPLTLHVSGITDLSTAKPLFESRNPSDLERFHYVPYTAVVSPTVYRDRVVPAFEAAVAARGSRVGSVPLEELDLVLDRNILNSDPATAVAQTQRVAQQVSAVAPEQDYLIDNISNTLLVAVGDATIAKRMFIFLGLPGAILAAILTAYAGTLLAGAQRRETALLRVRGANRAHLLRLLALRTLALAGIGSLLGTALGFGVVLALLGPPVLLEASIAALLQSALIGVLGGMLVTAFALYEPGRRVIASEIKQDLTDVSQRGLPTGRRLAVELLALVAAISGQITALRLGAFDLPPGSVYAGQSVSLPLQLLIAPIVAWLAATLLIAHLLQTLGTRIAIRRGAPQLRGLVSGVLWRSVTRRSAAVAGGVVTVGLVVALGTMLACFATVYDTAKVADARYLVGSDIRLTPNPTSATAHPTALVSQFTVPGSSGSTPVVFSPQNAVLTSTSNEDVATLAAIDPNTYPGVGALEDSQFLNGSANQMMTALHDHPDGILVNIALANGLKLHPGDRAEVLLGRGTDHQTRKPATVIGLFTQFPGAPKGTDLVANLSYYQHATGLTQADYFLVASNDRSPAGLQHTMDQLALLPGFERSFDVQTSTVTLDRDASSLTALNVRGLLQLNSLFTFLMAATATAMFVFGLLMQRRREYVTLRAQGMHAREVRRLVLSESGISASLGTIIGLLVGTAMATQFAQVLRPIFTLPPPLLLPLPELASLAALVLAATTCSALIAAVLISRLKPTELLRDE
jgi:putative ABC transport system permease protein